MLIIWLTGLSGSGKTTTAVALSGGLAIHGVSAAIYDGDELRKTISKDLGFSAEDRSEHVRRICRLLHADAGQAQVKIVAAITPREQDRDFARSQFAEKNFFLVYVSTPLDECARRDVKGYYDLARKGKIANFTGITSTYEVPAAPDLVLDTTGRSLTSCTDQILVQIMPLLAQQR